LSERPEWRDHSKVELRHLRTPDGDVASQDAVTNPAHWAILLVEREGFVDKATGQPVDEDDIDWTTEDHPSLEPVEGGREGPMLCCCGWQPVDIPGS
jgi:ParB family transcriptional regulator, chromosome partitioning protein